MKKISFGNKEYVKASEVAKQFRYTQDYVGQLCRAKKVDARLVGRTWYVEPDSVKAYRKTKHSTQKSAATKASLNKQAKRHPNPKAVVPVLRAKTSKVTQRPATNTPDSSAVSYSSDSEVSIPILGKSKDAKTVPVQITSSATAEPKTEPKKPSHKIKIKKSGLQKTKFTTEKLPEISLSGKLEVHNTSDEIEPENQPAAAAKERKAPTEHQPAASVKSNSPASDKQQTTTSPATRPTSKTAPVSFTPKQAQLVGKKRRSPGRYSSWFFVSLMFSICSAAVILSLASLGNISSTSADTSWSLIFDFEQLIDLLP